MSHTIITRIAFGAAALAGVAALGACGTTSGSAAPTTNNQPGANAMYADTAAHADSTRVNSSTGTRRVDPPTDQDSSRDVDTASAYPCASNQLTTQVVGGDAGMGNRYAAIQFTAKPGESCTMPGRIDVDLVGAHDVLINNEAPADAPDVTLSDGSSAYVQLHWTAISASDDQSVPNGITVDAPSDAHQYLDTIDLPWDLGGVDATETNHTIDVGAITEGTAPTA